MGKYAAWSAKHFHNALKAPSTPTALCWPSGCAAWSLDPIKTCGKVCVVYSTIHIIEILFMVWKLATIVKAAAADTAVATTRTQSDADIGSSATLRALVVCLSEDSLTIN